MTYRYIYKITCTAGSFKDKFYFGQRTTKILPSKDKYKGSGRKILAYYKKHPNNYIKEIISFHDSQEELNQAEYNIVHPWLNHPDCLNLIDGGRQGTITEETRKHMSEAQKNLSPELAEKRNIISSRVMTEYNYSKKHHDVVVHSNKNRYKNGCPIKTLKKMSESLKGKAVGKIWMHKDEKSIMVKSEEYEEYINKGYIKGRGSKCPWNNKRKGKINAWNKGQKFTWITLDNKHKQIKLSELQKYLDDGWHIGRDGWSSHRKK